jgi:hypothetical protein
MRVTKIGAGAIALWAMIYAVAVLRCALPVST